MIDRPVLRYHGGKSGLRRGLLSISATPDLRRALRRAAGVLLQKPRAYSEIYNDLDSDVVNFFQVLRDPAQLDRLLQPAPRPPTPGQNLRKHGSRRMSRSSVLAG